MKISDRRLRISDSLKISDFSNSLGVLQNPKHPQQYAYGPGKFTFAVSSPDEFLVFNRHILSRLLQCKF